MSEMISVAAFKVQLPFDAFFRALSTLRRRAATSKALNSLSARELEDIGLCRADIDGVVRKIA